MLSPQEHMRYSRQLNLPDFGVDEQEKLKEARVLVVGAGGLGCPVLQYLTAAGVGHIGIVDDDIVSESNLHRQVVYTHDDIGQQKVDMAIKKLSKQNPHVQFSAHRCFLDSNNAEEIVSDYNLVVDGTDNFPTRYLVNDVCVLKDKINVYGSVYRYEGQVAVFNNMRPDGTRGPNYRDVFPKPPAPEAVPNCAEGGVIGVLPGIIGCMQANEVIKLITGCGEPLDGKLLLMDTANMSSRIIKLKKNPNIQITELIDYEQFCGIKTTSMNPIKEITVTELKQWKDEGKDFQLIDVREKHEYEFCNLGGELIPLGDVMLSTDKVREDVPVVVQCRSGGRSANAILQLKEMTGNDNYFNLKGGILAWSKEIDPSVPQY